MAITFRIRENSKDRSNPDKYYPIKVRLSLGRGKIYEMNTGFTTLSKNWVVKDGKGMAKNVGDSRLVNNNLTKLHLYLHNRLGADQDNIPIDSFWLEKAVKSCFNRVTVTDNSIFLNHLKHMIDTASTRKVKRSGKIKIGLHKNTVKNYRMFQNIFSRYETVIKKRVRFQDINNTFIEHFTHWLINDAEYGTNTAGKQLDMVKTVCLDADRNEIPVHPHSKKIQHFRKSEDERYIHTFSREELNQIKAAHLPDKNLINARKWILIGCTVGQRGGDLLDFKRDSMRPGKRGIYIDVIQEKTGKHVTVPIVDEYVIDILENEFPFPVSFDTLNKQVKKVAMAAGIVELVDGYKWDAEKERNVFGKYPKWQLMASHCFRRSFATNYYKIIKTPVLMGITGHGKESTFLDYINKRSDKDANADLFVDMLEQHEANHEPKLLVVHG